jgi:hypothetical protein
MPSATAPYATYRFSGLLVAVFRPSVLNRTAYLVTETYCARAQYVSGI